MAIRKYLSFLQIITAVVIGILLSDGLKLYAKQCIAGDKNGCAETRFECMWNSRKALYVLPSCLLESKIKL